MTDTVREVVIQAIDRATGILNRPAEARSLMAGEDLDLATLDLDSLTTLEMLMEIEDSLGIELDADTVATQPTLDALVAAVARAVAAPA